jgi:hypothetical protein
MSEDLQHEVEAAREHLSATVSALVAQAKPQAVAHRATDRVKAFLDETLGRGPDADLSVPAWQRVRWDRIGQAAAAVALVIMVRKRRSRL